MSVKTKTVSDNGLTPGTSPESLPRLYNGCHDCRIPPKISPVLHYESFLAPPQLSSPSKNGRYRLCMSSISATPLIDETTSSSLKAPASIKKKALPEFGMSLQPPALRFQEELHRPSQTHDPPLLPPLARAAREPPKTSLLISRARVPPSVLRNRPRHGPRAEHRPTAHTAQN